MTTPKTKEITKTNPKGAGRNTLGEEPRKQRRLSLDNEVFAGLKELGGGNASQAIHDLYYASKKLDIGR